ncbi:hypothetical protein [Streptomyces sp. NPDC005262]|uniref:hypothetical protein n=1 Tax=Streptomyces sp. NPDC005262 TaxID=3364710 RepID=UPI003685E67B
MTPTVPGDQPLRRIPECATEMADPSLVARAPHDMPMAGGSDASGIVRTALRRDRRALLIDLNGGRRMRRPPLLLPVGSGMPAPGRSAGSRRYPA